MKDEKLIGIDLGGSSAKMVLLQPDGKLVESVQLEFDPARRMDWGIKIKEQLDHWKSQLGFEPQVGLSAPGIAAPDGSCITHMPGRLEGLEGLDWGNYLGLQTRVPVLNDAQAAALGEAWLGAAKGLQEVVLLTLGTGVGGAVLSGGQPLKGRLGRAGHLGHMSLNAEGPLDIVNTPGSLELAIGNATIQERTCGQFLTTHALVEAVEKGNSDAIQIWEKSIQSLAAAIASFINLFDPEIVLLGGGITRAGDTLLKPLRTWLDQFEWRPDGEAVPVKLAQLGELAGAYGAARQLQTY